MDKLGHIKERHLHKIYKHQAEHFFGVHMYHPVRNCLLEEVEGVVPDRVHMAVWFSLSDIFFPRKKKRNA